MGCEISCLTCTITLVFLESWQSGPMRGIANPMSRKARTGSNPVLSAEQDQGRKN